MADVIQVKPQARVRLQKNTGVILYDQQFAPPAADFTSYVGQSITLATNTSVVLSQGNIVSVRNALLMFDNAAEVRVNAQVAGVPIVGTAGVWVAYATSLTQIKVVNDSSTNAVNVQYIVTN